ncbi:thiamine phosphate synthase [Candidatus Pelagibacter sp.]|nr:thiamine phosphate synthase [Candidatus Pelagibacter sp.]
MHNKPTIYYFISNFNPYEIKKLNKNISLIYRNYDGKPNIKLINDIKKVCIFQKRKFYISNNLKIAKKLKLDGVYIPSFNNLLNCKNLSVVKKFKIIGSAHNKIEVLNKKKQGCSEVFISPIFKTKKYTSYLNICRFNLISNSTDLKAIALGGVNCSNYYKLRSAMCSGFAAISWIKKTGLIKKLGRL